MIHRAGLAVLVIAANPFVVAADSEPSPLAVLAQQAPNASAWVLAPLDRSVPPDIRGNLTFLREDLLDESKLKPKASAAAYQLGSQLCNVLIASLDERDNALVRAGVANAQANANSAITNQALEARRNYTMSWPQYNREGDQRSELQRQANARIALRNEGPVVDWANRGVQLRATIDSLYMKYRQVLRENPQILAALAAANATAPQPAPNGANDPAVKPPTASNLTVAVSRPPAPPAAGAVNPPPSTTPGESGELVDAVIQIVSDSSAAAAAGTTVVVTEALAQEEEKLIAEGHLEGGKFGFSVNPSAKCNIYVIADGYALFLKKGVRVAPETPVSLRPTAGTHVRLVAQDAKLSALGDDIPDFTAVRANQGSPPFQWIVKASTPDTKMKGGTVSERGDLWLKYGESVRITRDGQTASCKLLGSIARKYCIFECKTGQN